jgi:hypothetical protein
MISRKKKYYAGIGSRETPAEVLEQMENIATYLCYVQGYILRSGGAEGADSAFEAGTAIEKKEIYLPWKNFNDNVSSLYEVSNEALELAKRYHSRWDNLSQGAQKLHGRNVYQILGMNLKTPVKFVICWTKDGKASGGTGQAMRIAIDKKIPIFNLFNKSEFDFLQERMTDNKDFIGEI